MSRVSVPPELAGERADRVVAQVLGVSRSQARAMLDDAGMVAASTRMEAGQSFEVGELPAPSQLQPEPVDFGVVLEDEDLAIVNKPTGIVTHPGAGSEAGTLAAGLLHRWPELAGVGAENRWGIVHRLDRGTSGLLVVAKTDRGFEALSGMIRSRLVERVYLGLAAGSFEFGSGTIDAPVAGDPSRPIRRRVDPRGRPATTHYSVLEELGQCSLLEIQLQTGRTHQIRVHLSAIGHPLVGDRDYGSNEDGPGRVWLHSWRLRFTHPFTGAEVSAQAELPDDLASDLSDRR